MSHRFAALMLAAFITILPGACQNPNEQAAISAAADQLAALPFDSAAVVTVRGRIAMALWPEGKPGMILVNEIGGSRKFAFLTAGVPAMAKQGLTRFTAGPGKEILITGVLASGDQKIGPEGAAAARADTITMPDGSRVFDRALLTSGGAR